MALARIVKQLTAPQLLVLLILSTAPRPMQQSEIQASAGKRGVRPSIAEPLEVLEDLELVERTEPPPRTARFVIADHAAKVYEKHRAKGIADLKQTIAKAEKPHTRDGSTLPDTAIDSLKAMLKALETEQVRLARPRRAEDEEEEDEAPIRKEPVTTPQRSSALNKAKRHRAGDGPTDEQLLEREGRRGDAGSRKGGAGRGRARATR